MLTAWFWAVLDQRADRPRRARCLGQRSFNRQSTAFVMRMLWVRVPPLALPQFVVAQVFGRSWH